jgi:hypothetical protein
LHASGAALNNIPNFKQTSVPIFAPLVIPKTQGLYALFRQKLFAHCIPPNAFRRTMLKTVQFDREFCICTVEIEYVSGNRVLPPKFETSKPPAAKRLPQFLFLLGLITAKGARNLRKARAGRMQI